MSTKPALPSDEDRKAQIRAAGLRVTYPRVEVLRLLQSSTTPLSHAEIVTTLAPKGIDRVTVYRNLNDLAESGFLLKADLGDHVWRFELKRSEKNHDGAEHPHFVCDGCGDVVCLPAESLKIEVKRRVPRAVRRGKYQVQLKGECDRCAATG